MVREEALPVLCLLRVKGLSFASWASRSGCDVRLMAPWERTRRAVMWREVSRKMKL